MPDINQQGGMFFQWCTDCQIRYADIDTVSATSTQVDTIYGQANSNLIIEYCNLLIENDTASPHDDAIQLYLDTAAIIRFNQVKVDCTATSNKQGIYLSMNQLYL